MKPIKSQPTSSWKGFWTCLSVILPLSLVFFLSKPDKPAAHATLAVEDVRWQSMQRALDEVVGSYAGEVGVYIKDLRTGKTIEKNSDEQFVTASLIKLPIMAAAFQAISENKLSLNSSIQLRRSHIRGGSGSLKWCRIGRRFLVSHLLYRMVTESDNTAAQIFIDKLGYDALNQSFSNFGLSVTRIQPSGMLLTNAMDPALDNHTTPREMGMLLEKIYKHKLVNDGYCDLMIEIMKHAEGPSRLAKFLPKKWSLARKGGLLRKNCHDVGIIFTPNNDYIVCVMTGNNETYKKAKGLIAKVGQTLYPFMGHS